MSENKENKGERLHALDNLRAIMMWLGIVLHAAGVYIVKLDSPLPWRDADRTSMADVLVTVIHAFRMPVFFIIAGFFCALLLHSRGTGGMVRNRLLRLALPFAVFWPFVYAACGFAALAFFHLMARGTWGVDHALIPASSPKGPNTIHMWFLWMLFWMCMGTALLERLPKAWFAAPARMLLRLGKSPWGFLVLALPMMVAGMQYPRGILHVSGFFVPPWTEWVHHVPFFAFGLMMHAHRDPLFALFRARRKAYGWAGLAAFVATGYVHETRGPGWQFALAYASAGWLWSFALIGWALERMQSRRRWLAYLADSAYWVYLVHMPLTIAFGALLYASGMPAALKLLINIAGTTLVCLLSYELFVRRTWVSVLLNGKRHADRWGAHAALADHPAAGRPTP